MKYYASMDEEEKRAVREGLEDQDTLALYDLLMKPDLSKKDIEKLKKVAKELLQLVQAEKQKIDNWKEKQVTRDQIKVLIKDFLWDENKGLPSSYTHEDIEFKTEEVFAHVYNSMAQHK